MDEELVNINNDLNKEKFFIFYKKNKKKIVIFFLICFIIFFSFVFYKYSLNTKRSKLAENYIRATLQVKSDQKEQAIINLKEIINSNEPTYSSLALFFLIEENLVTDNEEILKFYNHLISNNKFDTEMKNILIYKKALALFEKFSENEMAETLKPIINSNSVLKSQALILLGDFFIYKGNYIKAKDTYSTILLDKREKKFYKSLAQKKIKKINGKIN